MNTLYLLRGVSGSGKSTLAVTLNMYLPFCKWVAADDYFIEEGEYKFDPTKLGKAHTWCQGQVEVWMEQEWDNIVVHNTLTTEKELQPYLDLAKEHGYKVVSLVVENRHGSDSVHDVHQDVRKKQEQRLYGNLKLI